MKRLMLALAIVALVGCAAGQGRPRLPYDYWYVGIAAPRYMEVWVESVDVIDRRGLAFFHIHGGVVGYTGNPVGWHKGGGAMKQASNVDLPETLFVRWQSLVEPQVYKLRIDIPQWVRDEMVKPQRAFCRADGKWIDNLYRYDISIGMAPGGIAKAWVGGPCLSNIEIGRYQAKIDPRGPSEGKTNGRYAWPSLEPESEAYIKEHGIPYGSW
ncbi:DUF2931 family protein [Metapseudomonas furukawaii]|uniref:VgrG protein n=1 Tax=Metapseudomonas furukawaii TaxID=1149133 RepID=A0AAD1C140_METFU|nr:DUF2931 family protein [Pseudomonas furukawaii]ELS26502.1 hypothetical protein ppKF707_0005 [Pseudomonas furukawaii]BAU74646.1 VgrG protein [Pseudomonas furukawaii]